MSRVIKFLLWFIGAFVALFVVAAVALYLFFDPNDFREEISSTVENQTGRELTIEGDISLQVFPWLAVEVGKSSLGNAPGFGDEPMASFDAASFSVRLLPILLSQEVVVGAASLEGLNINLQIDSRGNSNWTDLVPDASNEDVADSDAASAGSIDVNSIEVSNARLAYRNDEADEAIVLDAINLRIGRLQGDGSSVPLDVSMTFDVQPTGLSGDVSLQTDLAYTAESGLLELDGLNIGGTVAGVASIPTRMSISADSIQVETVESRLSATPVDLTMLDMRIVADVQPFSYAERVTPVAKITVDAFSPRSLMQLFDVAPPDTADPVALSRVIVDATAAVAPRAINLTDVSIKVDDTTFTGSLSVPRKDNGFYRFDLQGDAIELARYMAPADEAAAAEAADVVPVEIPVDLIRPLKLRGKLELASASLGNIVFEGISLGLKSNRGKLRLHPISSQLFGGSYNGDVRIDVSGDQPVLSLKETIAGVDLALLAEAMFGQENVTGSIEGSFTLAGRGADLAAIQSDLDGNIALELKDGSYQGTDIWYELRRARALLKGEEPPEPVLPAKTDFSSLTMSGVVADGLMTSDDLLAELPFMRLTGDGQINIPAATMDYRMDARILERPEFLDGASAEELDEFTEAVIPLKISGSLASPSVTPDIEEMLKERVEDELKDKLKDKLKGLFD